MTRPRQKSALVADLFCGAGGSSTGAKRALDRLGLGMTLTCVNHWPIAIETHSRNHPEARHYVQDIASVRPAEVVPEGYLDLLMASPTCTHHSRARGGKPTSDQQRSDPWHVITWLTELRVKRLLIENVPEFEDWGPVDPKTGKPIKSRKGEYFRAWVRTLRGLGFKVEWRVINSADLGAYTTRQRLYLIARSDGKKIVWPEPTHARDGGEDLFGARAKWKPARDIIDWQNKGASIFTRKKPLADKTHARIMAGARKFDWPEPFLIILRGTQPGQVEASAKSVDAPIPTLSAGGGHVGLVEQTLRPFVIGQHGGAVARDTADPLPTVAAAGAISLTEPIIIKMKGKSDAGHISRPIPTLATRSQLAVAEPLIAPYYGSGSGETCASLDVPLPTCTAKARFGVIQPVAQPIIIQTDQTGSAGVMRSAAQPLQAIVTKQNAALVQPFVQSEVSLDDEDFALALKQGRVFEIDGQVFIFDILFRMLDWPELARAMGFSDAEIQYEFAGNKAEITRQIGNAVEVNTAEALVHAVMSL